MTLHIITGAPCSGKSTYVREHAAPDDVRIDFDAMATALGSSTPHGSKGRVRGATFAARKAAIYWLLANDTPDSDSWIIHSSPADWQKAAYTDAGAEFVEMTTDLETCLARAEADERPDGEAEKIRAWFQGQKAAPEVCYKNAGGAKAKDGGTVTGYAATFDREPDSYGEIIAPGAFKRTVAEWKEKMQNGIFPPLLYGHNTTDPEYNIGRIIDLGEDENGLWVDAEIDAENSKGQYTRKLAQEGRLYQFSFAYAVRDAAPVKLADGTEVTELRDLDLYEVSLVQIPANQHAVVTGIKSGRRNSAKDADVLRSIAEHAREIDKAIADLLQEVGGIEDDATGADGDRKADRDAKRDEILAYIKNIQL